MKRGIAGLMLAGLAAILPARAFTPEMITVALEDGERVQARLCLPEGGEVSTIVLAIHGTGPATHLTRRQGFDFYDVLAEGFCGQGVGFFTYDRRGVALGDEPPMYQTIDSARFARYLPLQEARDVEAMVSRLRSDKRFRDTKIVLYGLSEGTIIASLVADRGRVAVDGLLLSGYAHEDLYTIVEWQNEGNGVMRMINAIYDSDGDGSLSREEYEAEGEEKDTWRAYLFQGAAFEQMDVNGNGRLDIADIGQMRMLFRQEFAERVRAGDDHWLRTSYFYITSAWLKAHFALEPNKTRMLRLDLPVRIFHGADDASVPVEDVYDLRERFALCGKENLTVRVFEGHDHELNFVEWVRSGEYSEGLRAVFGAAAGF